jgi:hypothetical protein
LRRVECWAACLLRIPSFPQCQPASQPAAPRGRPLWFGPTAVKTRPPFVGWMDGANRMAGYVFFAYARARCVATTCSMPPVSTPNVHLACKQARKHAARHGERANMYEAESEILRGTQANAPGPRSPSLCSPRDAPQALSLAVPLSLIPTCLLTYVASPLSDMRMYDSGRDLSFCSPHPPIGASLPFSFFFLLCRLAGSSRGERRERERKRIK